MSFKDGKWSLNPCGEIPLGQPQLMTPEWQLMLMNSLRLRGGLPAYTPEEAAEILAKFKIEHDLRIINPNAIVEEPC